MIKKPPFLDQSLIEQFREATQKYTRPPATVLSFPEEIGKSSEYLNYILISIYEPDTSVFDGSTKEVTLDQAFEDFGNAAGESILVAAAGNFGGVVGAVGASALIGVDRLLGPQSPSYGTSVGGLFPGNRRISLTRQRLGLTPSFKETGIFIALPMPKSIKTNYGFEYEDANFGDTKFVKDSLDTITRYVDGEQLDPGQINYVTKSIKNIVAGIASETSRMIPGTEGIDLVQAAESQSGVARTPYIEKVFKKVNRREFDFSYKMSPKSKKEMVMLMNIIKVLKGYSHPLETGDTFYLGVPCEFLIQYMIGQNENAYIPKMGRLALTAIDVSYGSEKGVSTFRPFTTEDSVGAFPVSVEVTLKFTELELLTRNRINEGY